MRSSKHDDLVEEVELTHVNPTYAHIRHNDGRESTVSLSDLAPCPSIDRTQTNETETNDSTEDKDTVPDKAHDSTIDNNASHCLVEVPERNEARTNQISVEIADGPRRSIRTKRKPQKYGFEDE